MAAHGQALSAARAYALREIARRAGVTPEFFRSWQCSLEDSWTVVRLGSNASYTIRFPNAIRDGGHVSARIQRQAARAAWAYPPRQHLHLWVPDFVIPFVAGKEERLPIFSRRGANVVNFHFDLLTAALFMLSRREEEDGSTNRDVHGRFPATASVASEFEFVHRPIVDEYGLAMEQALQCLLPGWQPFAREFRVKLSHDMDDVGIPFVLKRTMSHLVCRRNPSAFAWDFLSAVSNENPAYLSMVKRLVLLSSEHGLDSAIYWKSSGAGAFDTGYDPKHPKIQKVIEWLSEQGVECGVHPGYETYDSPEHLRCEVNALRKALSRKQMGGRQHYLRWSPRTWHHWESCDLSYDSTVGFADRIGFRAGTCIPYKPWLFAEDREANLIEIPLISMDCTPIDYMGLSVRESFEAITDCVVRCRVVGGVFTLLWHNTTLMDRRYDDLYERLLKYLSGAKRFDWAETVSQNACAAV